MTHHVYHHHHHLGVYMYVSRQRRSQEFHKGDKKGVWGRKSLSGIQRQSPGWGLRLKPPGAGGKCGCRLYRNTMNNTKHTNIEINTMKT